MFGLMGTDGMAHGQESVPWTPPPPPDPNPFNVKYEYDPMKNTLKVTWKHLREGDSANHGHRVPCDPEPEPVNDDAVCLETPNYDTGVKNYYRYHYALYDIPYNTGDPVLITTTENEHTYNDFNPDDLEAGDMIRMPSVSWVKVPAGERVDPIQMEVDGSENFNHDDIVNTNPFNVKYEHDPSTKELKITWKQLLEAFPDEYGECSDNDKTETPIGEKCIMIKDDNASMTGPYNFHYDVYDVPYLNSEYYGSTKTKTAHKTVENTHTLIDVERAGFEGEDKIHMPTVIWTKSPIGKGVQSIKMEIDKSKFYDPADVTSPTVTGTQSDTQSAMEKPGPPQNVRVESGNAEIAVKWDAPLNTGTSSLKSYKVSHRPTTDDDSAVWTPHNDIPDDTTTKIIGSLANGQEYEFKVRAFNYEGLRSDWSSTARGTPSVPVLSGDAKRLPGAPTGVTAAPGDGEVSLSWRPPEDDGGSSITGYEVGYSERGSSSVLVNAPVTVTTDTVDGLKNGVVYVFHVHARNSVGLGPESDKVSANPVISPPSVPGRPSILSVEAKAAAVKVFWTDNVRDTDSPVTSYSFGWDDASTHSKCGDSTTVQKSAVGTVTNDRGTFHYHTIAPLTAGTEYKIKVRAYNDVGCGKYSVPSSAIIPLAGMSDIPAENDGGGTVMVDEAAPPGAVPRGPPQNVEAVAGDRMIDLSWEPSQKPRAKHPNLDKYEIRYRAADGASEWKTLTVGHTADPKVQSAAFVWLKNDQEYEFKVRSFDVSGPPSGWSATAKGTPTEPSKAVPDSDGGVDPAPAPSGTCDPTADPSHCCPDNPQPEHVIRLGGSKYFSCLAEEEEIIMTPDVSDTPPPESCTPTSSDNHCCTADNPGEMIRLGGGESSLYWQCPIPKNDDASIIDEVPADEVPADENSPPVLSAPAIAISSGQCATPNISNEYEGDEGGSPSELVRQIIRPHYGGEDVTGIIVTFSDPMLYSYFEIRLADSLNPPILVEGPKPRHYLLNDFYVDIETVIHIDRISPTGTFNGNIPSPPAPENIEYLFTCS